ncbi:MAG TPA: helix-turn-helix transcriptional regulator [Desulfuromonadaceae bacterium]
MIGRRIREYRQGKKIKVADFATLIGISQGTLSDIENEKTKPSAETLSSIVRNTDIDAGWLLAGKAKEEVGDAPEIYQPPSAPPISPRIAALMNNFEALGEEDKRSIEKIAAALAQPGKVKRKAG